MSRPNTSGISALFKQTKERPKFIPEVLQALDETNGYETYQDDDGLVCVRIMTLDGQSEILVPNSHLEGLLHIVRAAMAANGPRRTRRSKEEIAAANAASNGNGIPEGQNPVSNNVMVNLMDVVDSSEEESLSDEDEEDLDAEDDSSESSESPEPKLATTGTRSRRRS